MKKRMISLLLSFAMVGSLLVGCGSSANTEEQESTEEATEETAEAEPMVVRLALSGSAHIFNAIADEQGYLEEEGITVEYVNCEDSTSAFEALQAGKVDVLSNYGTNLPLQYIGNGTDLTMFAGYMLTGCMPLIAKAGTEWNGVEDLVGKTVACEPNVYAVTGALLDAGYDPVNDITWLPLDNHADRVEAVRSGEADYAVLGTSQMYNAINLDDIDIVSYCSDITPNYSCCRIEGNTAWVNENPETVKALLRAWLRAQEYYEDHKEDTVQTVCDVIEAEPEFVEAYMLNEHYRLNIDPFKTSIERAWRYMLALGLFDDQEAAEAIDIDEHINVDLYKAALDEVVENHYDEDPEFYDTMMATFDEYDK